VVSANTTDGTTRIRAKPFLRWAGGKQQIVAALARHVPPDWRRRRYVEPFLGAGSLFFELCPSRAYLSDANAHLMECYRQVALSPERIGEHLQLHASLSCREHYYRVRDEYNRGRFSPRQAARFIYLNKACFNGIFRVNTAGQFNVPYGRKEPPALPSCVALRGVAELLRHAALETETFDESLTQVARGDFVYLDPPYPPLNGTAYFTHYTADRFSADAQEWLASCVDEMDAKGALFMMSNADTHLIRRLYQDYRIYRVPVIRYVTCRSHKHKVSELVITNY